MRVGKTAIRWSDDERASAPWRLAERGQPNRTRRRYVPPSARGVAHRTIQPWLGIPDRRRHIRGMFRLGTLGALSLSGEHGETPGVLAQPKRLAVLTYVAIAGARRPVRRDALLPLFWPDLREEQARQALRQTLYHLRSALGAEMFVGHAPDDLAVDPSILWCDAVAFEQAIQAGHLEDALALYHGDFLPAFFVANQSVEFDRWLDETRVTYRRQAAQAAGTLAKNSAHYGSPEQAVAWAERGVRLAPDDEGATRQLIETLERVGNRVGALRVYEDFSRRLWAEYKTRPAAATDALIAKIRADDRTGGRSSLAGMPPSRQSAPAMASPSTPEPVETQRASEPDAPAPIISAADVGGAVLPVLLRSPAILWGAAALIGSLLVAGLLVVRDRTSRESGAGGIPVLAILPFDKPDAGDESYVADGIGDEVRGRLAAVAAIRVISGSSTREYAGTPKTVQQIGRELGAQYLLIGRVVWVRALGRRDSLRIQVTPELVRTADGTTAWARAFDVPLNAVASIPGQIADETARTLRVSLDPGARLALARPSTQNPAAYDAYLRGAALFRVGMADAVLLHRAVAELEQAVALDTSYAGAWALLSKVRARLYTNSGSMKRDDIVRARVAAERALALQPTLAAAHGAMATYYMVADADNARALREYQAGLSAAPGDASMVSGIADIERSQGHWAAAIKYNHEAELLNPRSATPPYNQALNYLYLHRYEEALAASDRDLARNDGAESTEDWDLAAIIRLSQGDLPGARTVLSRALHTVDRTTLTAFVASYGDLSWALDESEQDLLRRLTPTSFGDDRFLWSFALMSAAGLRGDRRAVLAFADTARREEMITIVNAPTDPQAHVLLGVVDATLGRRDDAIREGTRAVTLCPISCDAVIGPYVFEQLARIYMLVGDTSRAVSTLDSLTKVPYYVTPAWLRIDPTWDPLRENAAFKRLLSRPISIQRATG